MPEFSRPNSHQIPICKFVRLKTRTLKHVEICIYSFSSSRCMESPALSRARSAKSVEDMADRRVSSLSTTSGCSDCTTATLQGAKSYGSSYFEDETPRLLGSDDNTSVSSDDDFSSNHSQVKGDAQKNETCPSNRWPKTKKHRLNVTSHLIQPVTFKVTFCVTSLFSINYVSLLLMTLS